MSSGDRPRRPRRNRRWFVGAVTASASFVALTLAAHVGAQMLELHAADMSEFVQILIALLFYVSLFVLPVCAALAVYGLLRVPNAISAGETYCGGCGYCLKGLAEPRCPECGRAI